MELFVWSIYHVCFDYLVSFERVKVEVKENE